MNHRASKSLVELRKEYGRAGRAFIFYGFLAVFDISYGLHFLINPTHPLDPIAAVLCFAVAVWANYHATLAERRCKILEGRLMPYKENKKND